MIRDIIASNENIKPYSKEIEKLKNLFPSCFNKNGFDLDKFSQIIKSEINITNESYELKFLGKSYAKLLASLDTESVIIPDDEHNNKQENIDSQNVYISGDNLDALKHLLKSYYGKIKCIYIDPPYNTGSDGFVYQDNFKLTKDDLISKLDVSEEQAERILNITSKGSSSHSAWLMFMYPRLMLARELLTDDGVIFISIDDNEQANLKLICDDIFGEDNFVSQLVWEKKKKGAFLEKNIISMKEYVNVYSKTKQNFEGLIGEIAKVEETYPCIKTTNPRGIRIIRKGTPSKYKDKQYTISAGTRISSGNMELIYKDDLVVNNGVLQSDARVESNWIYNQETLDENFNKGLVYITQDNYIRVIVKDPRIKKLKDLLLRVGSDNTSLPYYQYDENLNNGGWGTNEDGNDELHKLLGQQYIFDFIKPTRLIAKLIQSVGNLKKSDIILDFFSGSGTTADSVLQINSQTNFNLKYIVVQLPENIDVKYFASDGETKSKIKKVLNYLDSFDPNALVSDDSIYKLFGLNTILTTWLIHDGYGFTNNLKEIKIGNYTAYICDNHLYLIEPDLSEQDIVKLFDMYGSDPDFNPQNIVVFGYNFTFIEIENLKNNLKVILASDKNLQINIQIRY